MGKRWVGSLATGNALPAGVGRLDKELCLLYELAGIVAVGF